MGERVVVTGRARDLVILVDRLILALARHWLLVVNVFLGLYIGLAVSGAPIPATSSPCALSLAARRRVLRWQLPID
jgi:hypothetical protein